MNIGNFIVLLFRLTETFWTLVSNSKSVIYIVGRSGRGVSNSPPDHKPFSLWASLRNDRNRHESRQKFGLTVLDFYVWQKKWIPATTLKTGRNRKAIRVGKIIRSKKMNEIISNVWYLPSENTWKEFNLLAMRDVGTLSIWPFAGQKFGK